MGRVSFVKKRPIRKIGILGGSFNPAHDGHRHISVEAMKRLGLDEVWWLVSPQNPLKSGKGMATFPSRLRQARQVARHPRIRVTDLEAHTGTRYTADTVSLLSQHYRNHRFVWLMGADNLTQFHKWDRWRDIAGTVPIAVFARPGYDLKALSGVAAHALAGARVPESRARGLVGRKPPAWVFLAIRRHPESATRLRATGNGLM